MGISSVIYDRAMHSPGGLYQDNVMSSDSNPVRPFHEVNDLGGFGENTVDMLGRLCNFVDLMEHSNMLWHGDYVSLSYDCRHFAPASIASHIAYFFAANPRYGITPKRALIPSGEWVDDHNDLFIHPDHITKCWNEEDPGGERWPTKLDYVKDNIERLSFVFTHYDGLDCLYRALGITDEIPYDKVSRLRRLVDARVGAEAFADNRDPTLSVWQQEWGCPGSGTDGEILWRAFTKLEIDWDHIFTFPNHPEWSDEAIEARLELAIADELRTSAGHEPGNILSQYTGGLSAWR